MTINHVSTNYTQLGIQEYVVMNNIRGTLQAQLQLRVPSLLKSMQSAQLKQIIILNLE